MNLENYLKYVQNILGLKGVMMPQILESNSVISSEITETENEIQNELETESNIKTVDLIQDKEALTPTLNLVWENPSTDLNQASAFFLRIYYENDSLSEVPEAMELFLKLRAALGFSAQSAPLVQVSIDQWQSALEFLKQKTHRIILMIDDRIEKSSADLNVWQIPDPVILAQQIELKRPTWELLKEWKTQK